MSRKLIRLPAHERAPVFAAPRATADDVTDALDSVLSKIEEFKTSTDERIGRLENAEREANARAAMAELGGGANTTLEDKNDREAFAKFGRSGVRAAMSTDSNPDGGYLVPRTVEKEIYRLARDATPMRSLARVVTTNTSSYIKTVSLNGPTATWVSEKEARNQTPGMNLAQLEFPVMELQAMPAVTQTLLDDASTDVAAELAIEIATAFAEKEDHSFVSGDGNKKPRGFLEYTKVANASYAWGKIGYTKSNVASALFDGSNNGTDALYDLYYSLKAPYRANASWLMNSSTANVVSKLKDGDDNYLWQPSIQLGTPPTLLGRPVYIDENMPAIEANSFPIAFADWQRAYLIVDRIGVRVLRDPYSAKPYVLFYSTKRVGGGVQDFAALKLLKIEA
jgi:HK97 family phage major capsid protein